MFKFLRAPIQWVLFLATLGGGLIAARFVIGLATSPKAEGSGVRPLPVLAMKIAARDFQAPIVAYGTARAPRLYAVRSQVSGKVTWVSDRLSEGKDVAEGEDLLRIDTADLDLAVSQVEAQLIEIDATLAKIPIDAAPFDAEVERLGKELDSQRETVRLGEEGIRLARAEVDRLKRVGEAVSKSQLEAAERAVNQLEQAQMVPRARVDQIPVVIKAQLAQKAMVLSQESVLLARKKVYQTQLEILRLDLSRTAISSPAQGLVVRRDQETGMIVKQLARGDVVQAGVDLAWIRPESEGVDVQVSVDIADALYISGVESANPEEFDFEEMIERIPPVAVQWYPHGRYSWTGRVDRVLGQLDVATRNAVLVVNVAEPGKAVVPGQKVPLTPGMYCRVEIPGAVHRGAIVIPRRALHEGDQVYLARGTELEVRPVVPLRMVEDDVVIESGLAPGEVLILSELSQAIPGLEIQPVFE